MPSSSPRSARSVLVADEQEQQERPSLGKKRSHHLLAVDHSRSSSLNSINGGGGGSASSRGSPTIQIAALHSGSSVTDGAGPSSPHAHGGDAQRMRGDARAAGSISRGSGSGSALLRGTEQLSRSPPAHSPMQTASSPPTGGANSLTSLFNGLWKENGGREGARVSDAGASPSLRSAPLPDDKEPAKSATPGSGWGTLWGWRGTSSRSGLSAGGADGLTISAPLSAPLPAPGAAAHEGDEMAFSAAHAAQAGRKGRGPLRSALGAAFSSPPMSSRVESAFDPLAQAAQPVRSGERSADTTISGAAGMETLSTATSESTLYSYNDADESFASETDSRPADAYATLFRLKNRPSALLGAPPASAAANSSASARASPAVPPSPIFSALSRNATITSKSAGGAAAKGIGRRGSAADLAASKGFLSLRGSGQEKDALSLFGAEAEDADGYADLEQVAREVEKVDEQVRRIVFQAGLDYETRPIVVLAACNLPDPKEVNYDFLLDRILATMDLFVENDYTIVYMAGGGKHRPGWNWMWKAYKRLNRKFRKNLKKLYILHPTFFTRSLVQVISTGAYLISPKFYKKIVQVRTMSELATMIDIRQIDFPPEVLACNAKLEDKITLPDAEKRANAQPGAGKVFGVPLELLMGERGERGGVPRVLRDCSDYLRSADRLSSEGIFRRSPSTALLKAAQESYDRGAPVNLDNYGDPNIAAVLIKLFFRLLPQPIFPAALYPTIKACPRWGADNEADVLAYIRTSVLGAVHPPCNLMALSFALELLHAASLRADENKMDATNLATVFTPNLVNSGNALRDMPLCLVQGAPSMSTGMRAANSGAATAGKAPDMTLGSIIKICIERYYEVFDEMEFEPPTVAFDDSIADGTMLTAPSTPDALGSAALRSIPFKRTHRKVDSGGSSSRFANVPLSGSPHLGMTDASPSIRSAKSSEFRGPGALPGMVRNASGSLRLTKGRLGSSSFKAIPPALSMASDAAADADVSSPPLTGTSSGVTVSSASAVGTFASPAGNAAVLQQQQALAIPGEADAASDGQAHDGAWPPGRGPRARRELSVVEDAEE